jgi:hypothetical protein
MVQAIAPMGIKGLFPQQFNISDRQIPTKRQKFTE